jgi:enoyl-CoA hydratase/carnithine racemase
VEDVVGLWELERHDRIALATFSAPPRNFMTFAGMSELEGLVEEVAGDDRVTALVLASGVAGYFVSHGDLEDLVRLGRGQPFEGDAASWPRTLGRFASMPQIVVAAINGQTGGGGLEMTLACTMRVVGPRTRLGFVEVVLGLIPGGGGTQRLPRLIGPGRAAELILSGRVVGPEESVQLGIAERLEPGEPFLDRVLEWLEPIAARPAAALTAAKRAILDGLALPLEDGLALEGSLVGPLLADRTSLELQQRAIARYRETAPDQAVAL